MVFPPLFYESLKYAKKLEAKFSSLGYSRYNIANKTNFHIKFDKQYFNMEGEIFVKLKSKYLEEAVLDEPVFSLNLMYRNVGRRLFFKTLFKVIVHLFFISIGKVQLLFFQGKNSNVVLRKCYVEDVEALFDNECTLRAIYPFPLSVKRQLKYFLYLKRRNKKFFLDGVRYNLMDVLKFIRNPVYNNLLRLESRGNILLARQHLKSLNLLSVQMSDEYDFGSIYYSRILNRSKIMNFNSAHGAGKYLPFTNYTQFDCLTVSQIEYYSTFNPGKYQLRKMSENAQDVALMANKVTIVFLGQSSGNNVYVDDAESRILDTLSILIKEFFVDVDFIYKPHPNNQSSMIKIDPCLKVLRSGIVDGSDKDIVQFSLFSTCQIDPNFIGYKFLVETDYIKPAIIFGKDFEIINILDLQGYLKEMIELRIHK
jgi:hypothetical protein